MIFPAVLALPFLFFYKMTPALLQGSVWGYAALCDSSSCFGNVRKLCGKRRKCLLPAFSRFPTMFSKGFFLRVVKSWDCVVKA